MELTLIGNVMLTNKDYCDYETCVALKELGYKVPTSAYYMPKNSQLIFVINQFRGGAAMDCFYSNNSLPKECMASDFIDAPTMWEAQKFLRKEKKLHITIYSQSQESWQYRITKPHQKLEDGLHGEDFSSFEEALSEGIKEAIKHIEII